MPKRSETEDEDAFVRRFSSSPYLIAVAESLLRSVTPETLAGLMAEYAYLKQRPERSPDFLDYVTSNRLRDVAAVVWHVAPSLLVGVVADRDLRKLVTSVVESLIRRS